MCPIPFPFSGWIQTIWRGFHPEWDGFYIAPGTIWRLLEASVSLELLRATAPRLCPKPSNGEGRPARGRWVGGGGVGEEATWTKCGEMRGAASWKEQRSSFEMGGLELSDLPNKVKLCFGRGVVIRRIKELAIENPTPKPHTTLESLCSEGIFYLCVWLELHPPSLGGQVGLDSAGVLFRCLSLVWVCLFGRCPLHVLAWKGN